MKPRRPRQPGRAWWQDEDDFAPYEPPPSITVHEDEEDRWTGLYDAKGEPIMRPRNPIGFGRRLT